MTEREAKALLAAIAKIDARTDSRTDAYAKESDPVKRAYLQGMLRGACEVVHDFREAFLVVGVLVPAEKNS